LLVSTVARAQCTKDIDCKGDRVCEDGKCTSPNASPSDPPAAAPDAASAAPAGAPDASVAAAPPTVAETPPPPPPSASPQTGGTIAPPPSLAGTAPLVAVPAPPSDAPATRRRNKAAMVGGIVMVSAAPIALLIALSAANAQARCDDAILGNYPSGVLPSSERYRVDDCDGYSVPVYLFAITGAVLGAAGIPLIVYGAKKVPAQRAASVQMLPWATRDAGGLKLRLTL